MLPVCAAAYAGRYPPDKPWAGTVRHRQGGGGTHGVFPQRGATLLCLLVSQKTNPRHTMHGWHCDLSPPQTHYGMHHVLPVLPHAGAALGVSPARAARRVAPSPLALEGAPAVVRAGTERRRHRPPDAAQPKEPDSGTKHTPPDTHL